MKILKLSILFLTLAITVSISNSPTQVSAADGRNFNAGRIIEDSVFTNSDAMNTNQIQQFLNSKMPACDTSGQKQSELGGGTRAQWAASRGYSTTFTCLKDYYENPSTGENNYGGKAIPAGAISAAQIIYNYSKQFNLNPQVIIVTLQKEKGMITDDWPILKDMREAMGFGCPDNVAPGAPACDPAYGSFSTQIYQATRHFRGYMDRQYCDYNRGWCTPYVVGNNEIQWQANAPSCGTSIVNIQNLATSALYSYTPYRPNQAALNAGYGQGDGCSAYGNRNFYLYFSDWFNSTSTNATVYISQYNNIIDAAGAQARFGFSLSQKPVAPVVLVFTLSNSSLAAYANGQDRITIQPEDWNNAQKNTVTINGLTASQTKASVVSLSISQIGSPDNNFSYIPTSTLGQPLMIWQPNEGLVYRLYSQSLDKHIFTSRQNEIDALKQNGYQDEGSVFGVCAGGDAMIMRYKKGSTTANAPAGSQRASSLLSTGFNLDVPQFAYATSAARTPVYELYNAAKEDYVYTIDTNEVAFLTATYNYANNGPVFNTCKSTQSPIYRLYSSSTRSHFYTNSPSERDMAIRNSVFAYEGIGFYITNKSAPNVNNVYRLYSAAKRTHFYTMSSSERDAASNGGYAYEGVAFSIDSTPANPTPIYRLYNAQTGRHFYTMSEAERDAAVRSSGFRYEGVGYTISK